MKRMLLAAGLAVALGCRGAPDSQVWTLPGGVEPNSLAVQVAQAPGPEPQAEMAPVAYVERRPSRKRRRPAPPPTEAIQMAHSASPAPAPECAPDHQWLVGVLRFDAQRGRWFVRYASPGMTDRFGGELELLRTEPMLGFQPGQVVRVEGQLIDPAPLEILPAYEVRSMQLVTR
ncbi:MAG: hypothetical protein U0840_18525 [Gemmataceae bacterium]